LTEKCTEGAQDIANAKQIATVYPLQIQESPVTKQ